MSEVVWRDAGEVSLFTLATIVLRRRWRVVRWIVIGFLIALGTTFLKPAVYVSTASFVPKGAEASRGGLATLAGQFGIEVGSSSGSLTPDFYARLLRSRTLLGAVARDTLQVHELGDRRLTLAQVLGVNDRTPSGQQEVVGRLEDWVSVSVDKLTGLVGLSVTSRWPSISQQVASALVAEVNAFNERLSQDQASAERRFLEARMRAAGDDLRGAEDRLETFLRDNRQYTGSPDLIFAHDRLQRDVTLQQQLFSSLSQGYQDARLRELRDMPVATMVESPSLPTHAEPRGRLTRVLIGSLLGAFVGIVLVLASEAVHRGRGAGDPDISAFVGTLSEAKLEVLKNVRRLGGRTRG